MTLKTLRAAMAVIVLGAAALVATAPRSLAEDPVYTGTFSNLAADGYDVVAYFTEGRPVEGKSRFEHRWNGAVWRFASADSLAAFKADPEAYAPQYGGYCAWAVSEGYTASGDPQVWRIVGDKLYLNYSPSVQQRWETDIPGHIAKADANWPKVLE